MISEVSHVNKIYPLDKSILATCYQNWASIFILSLITFLKKIRKLDLLYKMRSEMTSNGHNTSNVYTLYDEI